MPRISEEIVFPTPRGLYMRRSTWSAHWHSVRASAQMPGQDFYDLRHRAIQWMIDPTDDGGLGLRHTDGRPHDRPQRRSSATPTPSSPSIVPKFARDVPWAHTTNASKALRNAGQN